LLVGEREENASNLLDSAVDHRSLGKRLSGGEGGIPTHANPCDPTNVQQELQSRWDEADRLRRLQVEREHIENVDVAAATELLRKP